VYRRILGPVYDNEIENWRILTNKEIYASVKKPIVIEIVRLNRLYWFGHVQRMEGNRIPKRVLYMNLGTRLRGRPRNRWLGGPQDRSGQAENLVPTGIRFRTVWPVAQSLYRLSYPAHNNDQGTVIPRLTKIIRSGITFVSRNLR
jgi:hypothetical protein